MGHFPRHGICHGFLEGFHLKGSMKFIVSQFFCLSTWTKTLTHRQTQLFFEVCGINVINSILSFESWLNWPNRCLTEFCMPRWEMYPVDYCISQCLIHSDAIWYVDVRRLSLGGGFKCFLMFLIFTPTRGKQSNFTSIFQLGCFTTTWISS